MDPDPRVHASPADLSDQLELAREITRGMKSSSDAFDQVASLRKALAQRTDALEHSATKETKNRLADFEKKIDAVDQGTTRAPGFGPVNRDLARIIFSVENADIRPADAVRSAVQQSCEALDKALANWRSLNEQDLASFNALLAAHKESALPVFTGGSGAGCKQ